MHKPALAQLVFARLFPLARSTDPCNLQDHITKNLIPEVRAETACFYGHLDCIEAQYPGLDYASLAHRLRLSRFPWHRRLFRAFNELRLTDPEIRDLCKWEGTRWARERYEAEVGTRVRDTTWDGIQRVVARVPSITKNHLSLPSVPTSHGRTEEPDVRMGTGDEAGSVLQEDLSQTEAQDNNNNNDIESDDELEHSVGIELNQRLMAATEARNRGEDAILDPDWEQWLKEAAERGTIGDVSSLSGLTSDQRPSTENHPQHYSRQMSTLYLASPARRIEALRGGFRPLPVDGSAVGFPPSEPPAGTAM
ncbi:MAG: hypothetical protein Q9190_006865 [Brigantiaea leucoxantha]